ncbi:hypothetical protein [Streptomyces sp. NPDC005799]|uniref:hypothetical protein n=1 Tax=Streptomyces sp. NPDC005799 TaxID=3154678 RepID=UPI0033C379B0
MSTLIGAALLVAMACVSVRRVLAARGPLGVLLARLGGRRAAAGAAECRQVQLLLTDRISPAAYRAATAGLARGRRPGSRVYTVRRLLGPRGHAT